MKRIMLRLFGALAVMSALILQVSTASAQGTAFSYQGRLADGGSPANGNYDLTFTLFGVDSGGSVIAGPLTNSSSGITNGLFTVTLDFGTAFDGNARWLEIGVRTNGDGAFTTLSPRQEITSTPYAIQSANAASAISVSGSVSAAQLTGTISSNNISAGSITTVMLAAGAVGSNQLADGAVTTSVLADGAVTAAKVATVTAPLSLTILTNPTPAFTDYFGDSVTAVGTDRMLIGVPGDDTGADGAGAAYLFSTSGTLLTTLTNPTPADYDYFGWSVAAVGIDRVLIGALYDDTGTMNAGAVYLFSTNGALLTTFTNPTPANGDYFGWSVAAVGIDRVLIGAPEDDAGATDAGAAHLFSINGALLTTFTNPTPVDYDYFGWSVAAVGDDRVLIGAPYDSTGADYAGVAYLFSTNGALLTTFTNPTPIVGDYFGYAVSPVGGDRVLIGAISDDTGAEHAGAAYLFNTDGALLTTFTNPAPAVRDLFGWSLATVGTDRVLIGAHYDDTDATDAGAAYLFSTNGALLVTFANPTPAADDGFGSSVAAVGTDRVLIGAWGDDTGASDAGAAYLFTLETHTPGLIADGVSPGSITTASLKDEAVTVAKLDPTIGVWTRAGEDIFRLAGNVGIGSSSFTSNRLQVAGMVGATAFNTTSDRAAKQDFTAVDAQAVLAKVAALPITEWRFKGFPGALHLGPMAQDFRAAFGLGVDDKSIATVDADGVALAAIQGLNQKLEQQRATLKANVGEIESLKQSITELKRLIETLAAPKE